MHPYEKLGDTHFWNRSIAGTELADVAYDPNPKFRFDLAVDQFGTAGSCFAQHFGRELSARGGQLLMAEDRHPLMPESLDHGYGLFSARYGNIYNAAQLKELFEQALGVRPPIFELARRPDDRWIDMLRPRAVPVGFSSQEDARADRVYHLHRVKHLLESCSVFVFTLGLTEAWRNHRDGHTYGICPGVVGGEFDGAIHEFVNLSFDDCRDDLCTALKLAWSCNPNLKILLTVSPVMLVATAEARGVLQSSIASKAILRATADHCARHLPLADYFPSFEIITGPQARGQFFDAQCRDVTAEGVTLVMDAFFRSRILVLDQGGMEVAKSDPIDWEARQRDIKAALNADCDEVFLGERS